MSRYISNKLKKLVAKRAFYVCEYCLAYEKYSFVKFQYEHIISLKHGGLTLSENLAYSCFPCNNNKGTDLGTVLNEDDFIRFYNPRRDLWTEHFEIQDLRIIPKTLIGEATIKILDFNSDERLEEREAFLRVGYFPHPNAIQLIGSQ